MINRAIAFAGVWLAAIHLTAQPALIPEPETLQPPSPIRLTAIHAAAQRDGWAPQVGSLRAAAIHAYERDKLGPAEAWFHVFRWASLLGEMSMSEFTPKWIAAVNTAKVGHSNMPASVAGENRPLGIVLAPELQAWLIGNPAFSDEYFAMLSPVDYLPNVFQILNELYRRDPAKFKTYASLALALAVVYDVPPPPIWPHGQVTAEVLPRHFPPAAETFAWLIRQEQLGHSYQRLSRLGAEELKFVVDVAAPFPELEWAQQHVTFPLNQLASAYSMIRYRTDRVTSGAMMWPGRSYKLSDILTTGGICADQAYFATQVGKARGVPTILIYGAGNDGRHAWFGFLDGNQKWELDAGRYAEQKLVTGYARDPQTWREFTDHELKFLSEHFHALPSYRQSQVHADFAAEYLAAGDAAAAAVAARKAVNYERRNQAGWETLIMAAQKQGRAAKTIEAVMREAALAFRGYPDLEAAYIMRVSESMRARGDTSAADEELKHVAHKYEDDRRDISVQQARNLLDRAIATQPLPEQIRSFNSAVDTFGRNAGVAFFDEVVAPFVAHLMQLRQTGEALRAIERARHTLKVEPNSQLQTEFEVLEKQARAPAK